MSRVRVLIVDDSVVIRRIVGNVLAAEPTIEIVGTAVNGRLAQAKIDALKPDVVTMDIEMPEMNGIEAVRQLRARGHRMPVIMFSTLTEQGAVATFDALAAGATDWVSKPANVGSVSRSMDQVRDALIPKILALAPTGAHPARPAQRLAAGGFTPASGATAPGLRAEPAVVRLAPQTTPPGGYKVLVVGSSTGGPEALSHFLGALPVLPVPIAVVQHMPPVFTQQFAVRLDRKLACPVTETTSGQRLLPGSITIAPGDRHLHLTGMANAPVARLSTDAPVNFCRPAVDVLFRSAVGVYGAHVLAVVLTGMGQDGCLGANDIVKAGGSVLAQDRATSVVWGMPGAVANAGLAEEVLPLSQMADRVARRLIGSFVGGTR